MKAPKRFTDTEWSSLLEQISPAPEMDLQFRALAIATQRALGRRLVDEAESEAVELLTKTEILRLRAKRVKKSKAVR